MVTTTFNANKVNGNSVTEMALGRQLDFVVLTTPVNFLPATTSGANAALSGNAVTQNSLNKLVEVISTNGQPVLLDSPYTLDGVNYTVKFAYEHTGAWTNTALVSALMTNDLDFQNLGTAIGFQNAVNAITCTITTGSF